MILELHLSDNNEKIILNMDRVNSIYQNGRTVNVYIGEVVYRVKESYEDIAKCIDKHYKQLIKVESENKEISAGYKSTYQQDYSDTIRDIKESKLDTLDKIRAEIEQYIDKEKLRFGGQFDSGLNLALKIIDKYKAESEE